MTEVPYDAIAGWYDELVRSAPLYDEIILPAMLDLAGDVAGLPILDVACGQGMVARALARRGALVTGIDISSRLLDLARRHDEEEPLGVRYLNDDAQSLATLADASFDGATCGMALMNVDDLDAAAKSIRRVLKPGGWFVAAITHPCYQTPSSEWIEDEYGPARLVRGYFDEGYWESPDPASVRGKVGEHHRTLSSYVNTFATAGLLIERISEPAATGRRAEEVPGNLEVPSILVLRFARHDPPSP